MNEKQQEYLKKAKEHALSKGGVCLSSEYINNHTKMEWICKYKHIWKTTCKNVLQKNTWCPECNKTNIANKLKLSNGLELAKKHALSKDGECLSDKYINSNSKLIWKCSNSNHKIWEATYSQVVGNNRWCPECGKNNIINKLKLSNGLELAKEHAISKGGECLSNEYINANSKLIWKCSNPNHKIWEAKYSNIINNKRWCPQCAIEKIAQKRKHQDGLERAKKYAESRNGKCLSEIYVNADSKLKWKCDNPNHKPWLATYTGVVNGGSWCAECSVYYYKEEKVRLILEYLLNAKFPKSKPKWNINPKTGKLLELDGFSKELSIAFEFQGEHHYKEGVFQNTIEDLEYIKYKDQIKKENCKNNNIKLIIIDDEVSLKNTKVFLEEIIRVLEKSNILYNKNYSSEYIEKIFKTQTNTQKQFLEKAKKYAESRGGKCLSEEYINTKTKLEWKCSNPNHQSWFALPHIELKNAWCPQCAMVKTKEKQKLQNGLELAKKYAESKGGKCLSEEYVNSNEKLEWKCSNQNHKSWKANYGNVVNNKTWCPQCAGHFNKKDGLVLAKKQAESLNGLCLSTEYIDNSTKMEWKCSNPNHKSWLATFSSVFSNKTWCPQCSGKFSKEDGLKKAKEHALSKGGECLSQEYINSNSKLIWKCSNSNHDSWKATYSKVVSGNQWCPQCAIENRKKKI